MNLNLIDSPVNIENENFLFSSDILPCLFLGVIIKNEYDNQRFKLRNFEQYTPIKLLHKMGNNYIPFYGFIFTPKKQIKKIVKTLQVQERLDNLTLSLYQNLLGQFELSCDTCFSYFDKGLYPIDLSNLNRLFKTKLTPENILSELLLPKDEKFSIHDFGDVKIFILM